MCVSMIEVRRKGCALGWPLALPSAPRARLSHPVLLLSSTARPPYPTHILEALHAQGGQGEDLPDRALDHFLLGAVVAGAIGIRCFIRHGRGRCGRDGGGHIEGDARGSQRSWM